MCDVFNTINIGLNFRRDKALRELKESEDDQTEFAEVFLQELFVANPGTRKECVEDNMQNVLKRLHKLKKTVKFALEAGVPLLNGDEMESFGHNQEGDYNRYVLPVIQEWARGEAKEEEYPDELAHREREAPDEGGRYDKRRRFGMRRGTRRRTSRRRPKKGSHSGARSGVRSGVRRRSRRGSR